MYSWLFFGLAILCAALIPFAPTLVRVRIGFFRWLHWNWAVNVLESYFQGWVVFVRVFLLVIAVVLFYIGWLQ